MINKELLVKKTYSKPEIEFVAFCYREVVSASEITDVDDDEEGIGGDDENGDPLTSALGFFVPKSVKSAAPPTSVEDSEGEFENTEGGGLGGLFGTDDGASTDTNTEQQEVQAEADGGFFDALGDVVSGNEAIEGGGDNGGAADDGGGDFSSGDTSGDTSSSGDSVWTE